MTIAIGLAIGKYFPIAVIRGAKRSRSDETSEQQRRRSQKSCCNIMQQEQEEHQEEDEQQALPPRQRRRLNNAATRSEAAQEFQAQRTLFFVSAFPGQHQHPPELPRHCLARIIIIQMHAVKALRFCKIGPIFGAILLSIFDHVNVAMCFKLAVPCNTCFNNPQYCKHFFCNLALTNSLLARNWEMPCLQTNA